MEVQVESGASLGELLAAVQKKRLIDDDVPMTELLVKRGFPPRAVAGPWTPESTLLSSLGLLDRDRLILERASLDYTVPSNGDYRKQNYNNHNNGCNNKSNSHNNNNNHNNINHLPQEASTIGFFVCLSSF